MLYQLWFNSQQLELILDLAFKLAQDGADATTQAVIRQIMEKIYKAVEEQ